MNFRGLSSKGGKRRFQISILGSLFIILTIPLAVYSLISTESFDTSSDASASQVCRMEFLYVQPHSIEAGTRVHVQVNVATTQPGETIKQISLVRPNGDPLFQKDYTTQTTVSEVFSYRALSVGTTSIMGSVVTSGGQAPSTGTHPCVLTGTVNNTFSVVQLNFPPEFKSDPKTTSRPALSFDVNIPYSYQLIAEDADRDNLAYSFTFTPGADWLKMNVNKGGTNGELVLNFSGVPTKPGSYLANVFVHDGYNQHLRGQSWVISVEQGENDIPKVEVKKPLKDTLIKSGDKLQIEWSATDLNQIVKYQLYYALNPADKSSWVPINENVSYKATTYELDSTQIPTGVYKIIVQAVDNQEPPAVGLGVSEQFGVNTLDQDDDGIVLPDPHIIGLKPADKSKTANQKISIGATLIAGKGATVDKDSIKLTLNGTDLTSKLTISDVSDSEVAVVLRPENELEQGEHKVEVSFRNSKGQNTSRSWSFTVDLGEDEDTINILGFDLPRRTAYIIGAGLAILLLALVIPWILYLAWRNSDEEEEYEIYRTSRPISPQPTTRAKDVDQNYSSTSSSSSVQTTSTGSVYTPKVISSDTPKQNESYTNLVEKVKHEEEKAAEPWKPPIEESISKQTFVTTAPAPSTTPEVTKADPSLRPGYDTMTINMKPVSSPDQVVQNQPQTPPPPPQSSQPSSAPTYTPPIPKRASIDEIKLSTPTENRASVNSQPTTPKQPATPPQTPTKQIAKPWTKPVQNQKPTPGNPTNPSADRPTISSSYLSPQPNQKQDRPEVRPVLNQPKQESKIPANATMQSAPPSQSNLTSPAPTTTQPGSMTQSNTPSPQQGMRNPGVPQQPSPNLVRTSEPSNQKMPENQPNRTPQNQPTASQPSSNGIEFPPDPSAQNRFAYSNYATPNRPAVEQNDLANLAAQLKQQSDKSNAWPNKPDNQQ